MMKNLTPALALSLGVTALLFVVGCGPAQKDMYAEIEPHETMIVLNMAKNPNEKNSQASTSTLAALEAGRMKVQRVKIPMSKHGYGWVFGSYQRVADSLQIIVDRSVVSRQLTKDAFTGDNDRDEALEVSSIGGVKVSLGVTLSGNILEEDVARYVYYYGLESLNGDPLVNDQDQLNAMTGFSDLEKLLYQAGLIDNSKGRIPYVTYTYRARPLSEVIDTEVVAFAQAKLSERFNSVTMSTGIAEKSQYFEETLDETFAFFKERGINLQVLGPDKGLQYENQQVQDTIDARFAALNSIGILEQNEFALVQTNQRMISIAEAEKNAALQFLVSYPAMRQEFEIKLRKIFAERQQILQLAWDGQSPENLYPVAQSGNGDSKFLIQIPTRTTSNK